MSANESAICLSREHADYYQWTADQYEALKRRNVFARRQVELPRGTIYEQPPDAAPRPLYWDRDLSRRAAEAGAFAGLRVEVVKGNLVVMSPKGWPHVVACRTVADALTAAFAGTAWVSRQEPLAILDQEPEPDAAAIPGDFADYHDHPATALLVVEVADTTLDYDLTTKAELYAEAGILDYWVLDLVARELHVLRDPRPIAAGGYPYYDVTKLSAADPLAPLAAPSSQLKVVDLLP